MKNSILILLTFLCFSLTANAQKDKKKKKDLELIAVEPDKEVIGNSFNRWSIDASFGQSKGFKPYTDGYSGSKEGSFFGGLAFNSVGFGARYMFSPIFGVKANINVDNLQEQNGSESLPFQMEQHQLTGEGIVNLTRLFDIQKQSGRFGLLFHFGFNVSRMTPKMGPQNKTEWNGGAVVGLTPQIRIFKKVSVFADFTINSNIRQHYNWDGTEFNDPKNNLTGSLLRTSIGLSVALGKGKIHGDWAIIQDKNERRFDSLSSKIGEIQDLMNDNDKDGVPDYLDAEQNSITGVAVDTKGRMVDKNNNGVPDELEKFVNSSIASNNNNNNNSSSTATQNALMQLINEGYIMVYFDSRKSEPNASSASNIGFILNYLKNNSDKSLDIIGYSDEIGSSESNNSLASSRAQAVKAILVKAGISESRLNIQSNGEDGTVDKNSDWARRLVRKTVFKVK